MNATLSVNLLTNKSLKIYRVFMCIIITLVLMLHTTGWIHSSSLQRMENILYDLRLRVTTVNTVDPRIVIIDVDEESLAKEGRWPWSRNKLGFLVDILFDYYGVKVLGFDAVFAERDTSSGMDELEKLATDSLKTNSAFTQAISRLRPQLSYDDLFAKSLQNRAVVLGYFTSHIKEKYSMIGLLPKPVSQTKGLAFGELLFTAKSCIANLPIFQESARSGGFFNNPYIDEDGIYRKLPLVINFDNQIYEALSLAVFRTLLGLPEVNFITKGGYGSGQSDVRLEALAIEGFTIPVDETGSILVPFRGRKGSFKYFSATDVLNGVVDKNSLTDKIVIVGTTSAGLLDSRATPVQNIYPGVEIHANIISALLDQRIKSRPGYIVSAEIIELFIICLIGVFVFPRLSAFSLLYFFLLLVLVGFLTNFYLWRVLNIDSILAIPLVLLFSLCGVQLFFGYFLESRKKKQLGKIFGQYIPSELVEQMSHSDEEFSLQGESRELTVFFSDVRGFTSISESMPPTELCELVNAIFTPVTRLIHESNGTIDKYIGDSIMAFWGAPLRNPEHARGAVKAALLIQKTLFELQKDFKARGWPEISLGIGINSGQMSVGNMGSEFRIAYTVMGDAVNLGSRLEGLTRQYGVKIIVSEATMQAAPEFLYKELDIVRVKGKQKAITIYEPLGITGDISIEQLASTQLLKQGLTVYRRQQWLEAREIFQKLGTQYPDELLYQLYLERIAYFQINAPEIDWDGVFTYTNK
jgi:adenylate cyclase